MMRPVKPEDRTARTSASPLPSSSGCSRGGKPLRVAAWVCSGTVLGAAIVDGHGPAVLRELLDELLASTAEHRRATRLIVWPNAQGAVRDLAYPPVSVEHDPFLTVVIEDLADFGQIPGALPVRSASANR